MADSKISEMTLATSVGAADLVPIVQGGVNKRAPFSDLSLALVGALPNGGTGVTNLDYTASTRLLTSDTGTDVTLPLVTSADAGLVPASGGGTSNYLRADGTWVTPTAALSTNAAVTAGTNAQGQGVLTSDFNVITTAAANPSGVTLPAASAGRRVVIVNRGANTINIYPAAGANINALAVNASIALPTATSMEFYGESATSWETDVTSLSSGVNGVLSVANGGTGNGTGSVATLTTTRTIGGSNFNGSANVTSFPIPGAIGGTTPSTGVFTTLEARAATSLLLGTAGSAVGDIGFRNATSGTLTLRPPIGALGTATLTLPLLTGTLSAIIASGTAALGTAAIASGASATLVTVAAAGVLTTDVIDWGFNVSPNTVTGYSGAVTTGALVIAAYPTAGNVNFLVSNPTAGSITPGALTLNWRVSR